MVIFLCVSAVVDSMFYKAKPSSRRSNPPTIAPAPKIVVPVPETGRLGFSVPGAPPLAPSSGGVVPAKVSSSPGGGVGVGALPPGGGVGVGVLPGGGVGVGVAVGPGVGVGVGVGVSVGVGVGVGVAPPVGVGVGEVTVKAKERVQAGAAALGVT